MYLCTADHITHADVGGGHKTHPTNNSTERSYIALAFSWQQDEAAQGAKSPCCIHYYVAHARTRVPSHQQALSLFVNLIFFTETV